MMLLKKGITTLIGITALTVTLLNGCAHKNIVTPCGAKDYIEVPEGGKILDVPLPTDEGKLYTVIVPKNGFWMSLECHNRMEKGK